MQRNNRMECPKGGGLAMYWLRQLFTVSICAVLWLPCMPGHLVAADTPTGTAAAGSEPPVVMLDIAGRKTPFVLLNGRQYRVESAVALRDVAVDVPVAVRMKVTQVEQNELFFWDSGGLRFLCDRAKVITLPHAGDNVFVGGMRKNAEPSIFTVEAIHLLPDDLTVFNNAWRALAAQTTPTPEMYYDLGDDMDEARRHSRISDQAIFTRYEEAAKKAWAKGLELDEVDLAVTETSIQNRLKRYQDYLDELARTGSNNVSMAQRKINRRDRLAAYSNFLSSVVRVPDDEMKLKTQAALAAVVVGTLRMDLIGDRAKAEQHFFAARQLAPQRQEVRRALLSIGYKDVYGLILSPEEARERLAAEARKAAERQRMLEQDRSWQLARRERQNIMDRTDFVSQRMVMEQLLSSKSTDELLSMLDDMPGDVAREALFAMTANQPAAREQVITKALSSQHAWLRRDGAALAVAYANGALRTLLTKSLAVESRPDVVTDFVHVMMRQDPTEAVDMFINLLNMSNVASGTRQSVATRLKELTGQSFEEDGAAWRTWWIKAREGFVPQPKEPGTP